MPCGPSPSHTPWPAATAVAPLGAVAAQQIIAASNVGIPPEFRGLVFGEIVIFIIVLAAAFAYAWKKGVFEWR